MSTQPVAATPAPDPVLRPGAALLHQRFGTADYGDLLARTGGEAALAHAVGSLHAAAVQLDSDAATLTRKLRSLADYTETLQQGGRLTPVRAGTPMATLGAEIDLLVHSIDLGTDTVRRLLAPWEETTAGHVQPTAATSDGLTCRPM